MIRKLEPPEAAATVKLLRELAPDWVVTPRGLVYKLDSHPERGRQAWWVALADGEVVGYARARLRWEVSSVEVGSLWVGVRADKRGRGIGSALYQKTERHLSEAGATKLESFSDEEVGCAFLERRGFERVGAERMSALDPRGAELERSELPAGFRLEPLGKVYERSRELHAVYAGAAADIPDEFTVNDLRYEEWVRECLDDPDLDRDGSFVVLAGERPVSLAFLLTDREGKRAGNEMTGTLPGFRRRGLAYLAKAAAIRWAAKNGITRIMTTNDEDNRGMLALNEKLGYRPVLDREFFLRAR